MVFVSYRHTKQCHKAIAQELVDGTLIAMDIIQCQLNETVQEGVHVFGIDAFRDGGRIGEIAEEHCDLFAFAFEDASGRQNFFSEMGWRARQRAVLEKLGF